MSPSFAERGELRHLRRQRREPLRHTRAVFRPKVDGKGKLLPATAACFLFTYSGVSVIPSYSTLPFPSVSKVLRSCPLASGREMLA